MLEVFDEESREHFEVESKCWGMLCAYTIIYVRCEKWRKREKE